MEISRIESWRENGHLEAKLATGGLPESIWETYSAFANTGGGLLLLGVEERSDHSLRVQGLLNAQEMLEEFLARLRDPGTVSADLVGPDGAEVVDTGAGEVIGLCGGRPAPRGLPPGGRGRPALHPGGGGAAGVGGARLSPFPCTLPSKLVY